MCLAPIMATMGENMNIEHFEKHQHWYKWGAICTVLVMVAIINATTKIMDGFRSRGVAPFETWEPFSWEFSSALGILVLTPALVWLVDRWPIEWGQLKKTLLIYSFASLIFSIIHITVMVVLRKLIYLANGSTYDIGNVVFEFFYEYRKDLWTYILILSMIYTYRFVLSRLRGEAKMIADGEDDLNAPISDRILVKKLGKEFIVKLSEVEWLEACGNYVNLHVKGRIYPTRSTLAALVHNISDQGFCRIHRSFAVNLDRVESITASPSGDGEVQLIGGKVLKLSRRYKEQLKANLH